MAWQVLNLLNRNQSNKLTTCKYSMEMRSRSQQCETSAIGKYDSSFRRVRSSQQLVLASPLISI